MSAGAMQNPGNRFTRLTKWGEIMGNIFAQKDLASFLDFTTYDPNNTIQLSAVTASSIWTISRPAGVSVDERVRVKKQLVIHANYPFTELTINPDGSFLPGDELLISVVNNKGIDVDIKSPAGAGYKYGSGHTPHALIDNGAELILTFTKCQDHYKVNGEEYRQL